MLIADYSQIELRVVAQITQDPTMLQSYQKGLDLHKLTASLILDKDIDEISRHERQAAKAVNFGLVYGMGSQGLKQYAQLSYGIAISNDDAIRSNKFRKKKA